MLPLSVMQLARCPEALLLSRPVLVRVGVLIMEKYGKVGVPPDLPSSQADSCSGLSHSSGSEDPESPVGAVRGVKKIDD